MNEACNFLSSLRMSLSRVLTQPQYVGPQLVYLLLFDCKVFLLWREKRPEKSLENAPERCL